MFLIQDDIWQIKKTKEKGFGVFAKKKIQAGTIIGDYLGKVVKTAEYNLENDKYGLYLMYFSDEAVIFPDLNKPDIHLINHSCSPNCFIYSYKGHSLFFALKTIYPNKEITISYLLSPKDKTCDPCTHDCKCESALCRGTMHLPEDKYKKWRAFQSKEMKKTRRTKVVFGKELPPLTSYPTIDPQNPIYATMLENKISA